jgi:hypothetical protein
VEQRVGGGSRCWGLLQGAGFGVAFEWFGWG